MTTEATPTPTVLPSPVPTMLPSALPFDYLASESAGFRSDIESSPRHAGYGLVGLIAGPSIIGLILLIAWSLVSHFQRRQRRLTNAELKDSKLDPIPIAF